MSPSPSDGLADLLHDVGCSCTAIRDAAALLGKAPVAERRELLKLMAEAARKLARRLGEAQREIAPGA
ncbi:MAG: hypothetical protein COV48_05790 [Elusimicrobia bacterium CG11_big_fil_rev_8_21_14_0_20_64_6]|nr:MAG: hypothetical protein COV48_05790 [Elusimicrobia bacterium CG11_big_fil_rev_8_21_14_0_20_64_6]